MQEKGWQWKAEADKKMSSDKTGIRSSSSPGGAKECDNLHAVSNSEVRSDAEHRGFIFPIIWQEDKWSQLWP